VSTAYETGAAALAWLVSARAAFSVLTWYDVPYWSRTTCRNTYSFHTHDDDCYELNLLVSRRLRTATAALLGPAVIAVMVAWCWGYGLVKLAEFAVTARQPRTRREIEAEEKALCD